MIWNRGEDFEKQQQNHDDILSPPSLKKHRLEEHPERPPLESKESKNAGFWAHYTKSAQVYSQGSSLRSPLLKRKVTVSSSFLLPQNVFSRQSSGTSIWVLQVTVSYQNVYLLANHHSPVFWLYSIRGNPALNINTPKGWEVLPPPGSLAPWVNMQQANGLMGPGWTA